MRTFLLFLLIFSVTSLRSMYPVKPFDGDPQKARNYIAAGKIIESWMVNQTIEYGKLEVLQVLIDEGKVPADKHMNYHGQNTDNTMYLPPLHQAARANIPEIINYLITAKKVDPNSKEPTFGFTAAHLAINNPHHCEALEAILQYPIDITLKDFRGQTVEERAREFKNTKAIELIEAYKNKQK